jgi:hypothetical protein
MHPAFTTLSKEGSLYYFNINKTGLIYLIARSDKEKPIDKLSSNFCDAIDAHTFVMFLLAYCNEGSGNAAIDAQAKKIWNHLAAAFPAIPKEFSFPSQSQKGITILK